MNPELEAQSRRMAEVKDGWSSALAFAMVWLLDRSKAGDHEAGEVYDRLDAALTAVEAENVAARSLLAEHGRG